MFLVSKLQQAELNKEVSMVEGLTVPVTVTPSEHSCTVGSCGIEADPLMNCDSRLVYPKGENKICR